MHMKIILDGDNCWTDWEQKRNAGDLIRTEVDEVALLISGMASDKSSVAFRINLPDGKVVFAETSLEMLEAAVMGFRAREVFVQSRGDA